MDDQRDTTYRVPDHSPFQTERAPSNDNVGRIVLYYRDVLRRSLRSTKRPRVKRQELTMPSDVGSYPEVKYLDHIRASRFTLHVFDAIALQAAMHDHQNHVRLTFHPQSLSSIARASRHSGVC